MNVYIKYLCCIFVTLSAGLSANAKIVTYPAPTEVKRNTSFSLEIAENNNGSWLPVDVYNVMVQDATTPKYIARNTSMAYFDCDCEVNVRVISNSKTIETAKVRPLSQSIVPIIDGDTLYFSVMPGQKLSVEINGDIFDNLHLFINPIDENAPDTKTLKKLKKDKNYIYFGPGFYKVDSLEVKSNQTLYVAGGAVLEGRILVKDANNVKILGRGMIYPQRQSGIQISRSKNVVVDGLFTTQCPIGNCDSILVKNVKVMSYYNWGDGFNIFASTNIKHDGVFARTSDDCTTIYCTRLGYTGSCANITMQNSVLWADVAHPITIGLHGSFDASTPDSIVNALYHNIDILDMNEHQLDYQGALTINAGDNNLVKHIRFEDIRIEDFRKGRLFDIRIPFNKKYCMAPGRGIQDVLFKDIVYDGENNEVSLIIGYDETHAIDNITFEKLRINGKHIKDDMPEKPKWFKTGDFARIFIGEHVNNVQFK
ncbi:MAG: endo-polygalacturonase [Bacteroidaceae bacterium]|nr:endo-polygalacturonase [Bacteroidaceae bacterium]